MLQTLSVKDFAIVGEAEIALGTGMTAVTGETGAGKSLLVDALLLLAGQRADTGVVRHGCARAELTAAFSLADAPAALAWLKSEDFDDGDMCQIRRVIRNEGASRAWINGRPATLAQLQVLAETLIEIHGQHEHQALLQRAHQLALLDAYGGHGTERDRVAALAGRWRDVEAQIRTLSGTQDHAERIALLEHQLGELDRHALLPAEFDALNETHKRLANAGQLLQGSAAVAELLDGDSEFAALRALTRARNELSCLAELDPALAPARELLDAAAIQLGEAHTAIGRYRDGLELDPDRYAETEAQIAKLHELSRKHRIPAAELKTHAQTLRAELEGLRGAGEKLETLRRERDAIRNDYAGAAAELSQRRLAATKKLDKEITALMAELGMPGGRFTTELAASESRVPDAQGAERADFLVSANPGQPPRPLRKVASGGELSRIALAVEVAALGLDDIGTMVFDEVDSGIGGSVAEIVGRKLRRLGGKRQVLCVTHLPQVAAQAHAHLRVAKSTDDDATAITIETLDGTARRNEIARMLGGVTITPETLAHAQQMLVSART
ncbi:MAG: DNA repair protein RecN [Xanthomonadaceae bacterium]|nr:DNA repair protein RecN [Xanthomonadaceae bacterium]MDE2083688.1 DNA repair protein RecN [Xanthomonadaceae bacterium]